MPVHVIKDKEGHILAFKYGNKGKRYDVSDFGKAEAAKRAYAQEAAIEHSEKKDPPKDKEVVKTLKSQGESKNQPDSKYDKLELETGKEVEKEHVNDPDASKEIAKDHLEENPKYYSKVLAPSEKEVERTMKEVAKTHGYKLPDRKKDPPKKEGKDNSDVLSYEQRKRMKKSSFALPKEKTKENPAGEGGYPIPDIEHARNALARVAQHGTPEEQRIVREKVRKKFPSIDQSKPGK